MPEWSRLHAPGSRDELLSIHRPLFREDIYDPRTPLEKLADQYKKGNLYK
jgi:hypothetical protein